MARVSDCLIKAHALRQLQNMAQRATIARMKTIFALILAAVLSACGNSNTTTPAPETAASAPTVGAKGMGGGGR